MGPRYKDKALSIIQLLLPVALSCPPRTANTPDNTDNMSHLTYYNYDGVGKRNQQKFKYSQAVRVGDRIECAGQGTFIDII